MSLKPLKCKACNLLLKEHPIIVGETEETRQAHTVAIILQHFDTAVMKESQDRNPATNKPHLAAMHNAIAPAMMTAKTWLTMRVFDLPEYMESAQDRARRSIHGATLKRRMSEEQLEKLSAALNAPLDALRNLRDFYEEIGQYAPADAQPKPTEPALVKP